MNIALIVAAGVASRMGNLEKPKQFLLIKEKPLFLYSVLAFENNPNIDTIIIVTSEQYIKEVQDYCSSYQVSKVKGVVVGGKTRQESVYHGLIKAKELSLSDNVVLIHDAARPLVSQDVINNSVEMAQKFEAVTTVINASDTIIRSMNGETIDSVPKRQELYQSQTPQSFKLSLILAAHENAINNHLDDATDDAQLVLALGHEVHLVKGDKQSFKITTADDLTVLESLLK